MLIPSTLRRLGAILPTITEQAYACNYVLPCLDDDDGDDMASPEYLSRETSGVEDDSAVFSPPREASAAWSGISEDSLAKLRQLDIWNMQNAYLGRAVLDETYSPNWPNGPAQSTMVIKAYISYIPSDMQIYSPAAHGLLSDFRISVGKYPSSHNQTCVAATCISYRPFLGSCG